jgi:predicted nucleotidyltransferase
MRLSTYEINSIKDTFKETFKDGKIFLFGSRVDDNKRGGDIDLYIQIDNKKEILSKKIKFLVNLKEKIGDQKIDLLISKDETRVIEKEALSKGIKL